MYFCPTESYLDDKSHACSWKQVIIAVQKPWNGEKAPELGVVQFGEDFNMEFSCYLWSHNSRLPKLNEWQNFIPRFLELRLMTLNSLHEMLAFYSFHVLGRHSDNPAFHCSTRKAPWYNS